MSRMAPLPTSGPYSNGLSQPTGCGSFWFSSATSPAYRGDTALVPPIVVVRKSTRTR
ncbi:conserved hypothetical protein [Ricinus communis]|uniref:Uncharacterized protein n=1 Tax=Ricinus communis TaxID=3988 RepID=B9TLS1_RICCO|nr:conserved hypothetical protein [Ricinus communis]